MIVAGVIYNVARDELFWAEKGAGAYLNDKRLRVSGRGELRDALLATGMPFAGHGDRACFFDDADAAKTDTVSLRRMGAASLDLAYVAAGRFDGFWERHLNAWDIAAGAVIVREAGGFATEIDGGDFLKTGAIIAANERLMPLLSHIIRNA